ncbi:MAG TPA: hypothetical protein VJO72_08530, partial [Candidatus Dormibacteraeota bacterium]|nr:hypothetical protein [Candidatus Dormibacteraeota bacterium]
DAPDDLPEAAPCQVLSASAHTPEFETSERDCQGALDPDLAAGEFLTSRGPAAAAGGFSAIPAPVRRAADVGWPRRQHERGPICSRDHRYFA